jgi:hypothetical protein
MPGHGTLRSKAGEAGQAVTLEPLLMQVAGVVRA